MARKRDWRGLWWLVLAQPLPQAAGAAAHLNLRKWTPPSDADARLAEILTGVAPKEAVRLGAQLFERTTSRLPDSLGFASPVGFSVRHPVVALDTRGRDMHTSRVVTVDRTGVRSTLYEGPAQHWSLCAIDSETVVARREFDSGGYRGDTEIVEYTPGREAVLANGGGLLDAVVEATATGFVVGTKMNGIAFAVADGEQEQLNLREFGFRRADLFAVDATGTRIAFADDTRILVTDSRLQPLHDIVVESLRHGQINAITFTEDSIVTAGYDKGLYRWQIIGGRIRGLHDGWHSSPRTFFRLNPVAPWNLLVAEGGNVNYHYDIATLERRDAPDFLVQAGPDDKDDDLSAPRAIGKFASSPYGRLAVYEGGLALPTRASATDFHSTVVQDLEHPLTLLMKPVSTLTTADADRVRPHLDAPPGTQDTYALTATERAVLAAAIEACAWAPKVTGG
ncbi:hypothetical protein [Streptomyces acidicola]|uniref:Uncharacterized protein n=1 Tax=Streptomyces acidicola TaxID=2596892 RepID=A0A5N8X470_9ACTN|nr:hypothetical protein [Streptomyces acidicola]MPY54371.1 hypothetical protein [Streptomyces acidicola]